jgi:acetyl-CoA carboxylase beta subunit
MESGDWIFDKPVGDMTFEEKEACIGYLRLAIIEKACREIKSFVEGDKLLDHNIIDDSVAEDTLTEEVPWHGIPGGA